MNKQRLISLALQGGGAHGAFTWGVLEVLLEERRLRFDGISGTSAGAMNAVVLAHGLRQGGRQGAQTALEHFWTSVAKRALFTVHSDHPVVSCAFKMMLNWADQFSPEQLNPLDINPLRTILAEQIDFDVLHHAPVELFIAATHVNSGRLRLFHTKEITLDALLASACLPNLHRTIKIDGEPYWDGAFAANPAVFPLFYECKARDIVLVLLNPIEFAQTPINATDIKSRMRELAFNATFLREMRMFAHLDEYIRHEWLPLGQLERRVLHTYFHIIETHENIAALEPQTKLTAHLRFLEQLRSLGHEHAQEWLSSHFDDIGQRSSVDLAALFY